MKKILILILGIIVQLYPQELFRIKESRVVVVPPSNELYYTAPQWSPVADQIAFSSNNYHGIWLYDLEKEQLTQMSNEISAGFGFSWSADGKIILARVSKYQQWKCLSAIKLFNIEKHNEAFLSEYKTYLLSVPYWTPAHNQIYYFNGREIEYLETNYQIDNVSQQRYCYSISDKIIIVDQARGERNELQPFPEAGYLNLTLSPDGQYIAFEVYGGNCFIMNLENLDLVDLGKGNRPQWSRDSQYLSYVLVKDDGYRYTAADIYISNLTGTVKQNITADMDRLAMYPTWSPSGLQIAYSTHNEGTIELIELEK
jgi:Tol biopolymer transport system component